MKIRFVFLSCCFTFTLAVMPMHAADLYIRINQAGYLLPDAKIAIAFSRQPVSGKFELKTADSGRSVLSGSIRPASAAPVWGGQFSHYYDLDFSSVRTPGKFYLEIGNTRSSEFSIGEYPPYQEDLLFFMRQQRCGYNPFLDMVCHQREHSMRRFPMKLSSMRVAGGMMPAIN